MNKCIRISKEKPVPEDRKTYADAVFSLVGGKGYKCFVQTFGSEAVTVIKTVGNKAADFGTVAAQNQRQERAAGDTVSIVVPVNKNVFIVGNRLPDTGSSLFDPRETVGIAEISQLGVEKACHLFCSDFASGKIKRDGTRQIVLPS